MLTQTSCILRSDRTESIWMPTDLVKFPVHSIHLLNEPAPGRLLSLFFYVFFLFLGELVRWRWGGGVLSTLVILVHMSRRCVCVCVGVCACERAGDSVRVFVFQCVSVSLCFVWLRMSISVCVSFTLLCMAKYE